MIQTIMLFLEKKRFLRESLKSDALHNINADQMIIYHIVQLRQLFGNIIDNIV